MGRQAVLTLSLIGLLVVADAIGYGVSAWAIESEPTKEQIMRAVKQGLKAAQDRIPPNRLHTWFGSDREFEPKGFLMTKMNGLTVMASHFGLRGEQPTQTDIDRIVAEEELLVAVYLFGNAPTFATDSYIVLKQGERLIKPRRVRFDAIATRTALWPETPGYRAKVLGYFGYADLDPNAMTTILAFPGRGGEASFQVDFSKVP